MRSQKQRPKYRKRHIVDAEDLWIKVSEALQNEERNRFLMYRGVSVWEVQAGGMMGIRWRSGGSVQKCTIKVSRPKTEWIILLCFAALTQ
jgi:hypothetical protein